MVAVNNRLFQKTKQKTLGSYEKECKQTVDHMEKKNSRKTRDLHIYSEKTGSGHIYITLYYGNVQKKFSFLLSDLRKK